MYNNKVNEYFVTFEGPTFQAFPIKKIIFTAFGMVEYLIVLMILIIL